MASAAAGSSSSSSAPPTIFLNGQIFSNTSSDKVGLDTKPAFVEAMAVENGVITAMGSRAEVAAKHPAAAQQDLGGRTVLPGFVDGHMHLLLLGQSLRKVSLDHCKSLADVVAAIAAHAKANPDAPRILAQGWMRTMTPGGVDFSMLDAIDDLRPIFVDSKDLHSTWCNSAALAEMGVQDMPDPAGGKIERDAAGRASGVLSEGAILSVVWPHLAYVASMEERKECMVAAFETYNAAGYTGLIEMAMDEPAWEALVELKAERPDVAMRIVAYWIIKPSGTHEERARSVSRAVELHRQYNRETSPDLRIAGIKIICDGIVDACTAYLSEPYATNPSSPPFWNRADLEPIVKQAVDAGVQVALHAIGDAAITMAVDVLEQHAQPGSDSRHRIEHLELASPEDAQRLGRLGITASIQPVHADPAILRAWPGLLGNDRCGRAFAYREFGDAGALLALGSDAPTSPFNPLHNIYVAATRRSAREPASVEAVNEKFRLGVCEAVVAGTAGAARSVFLDDHVGTLEVGKAADMVVVDMEWEPEKLLKAEFKETWFAGRKVWASKE